MLESQLLKNSGSFKRFNSRKTKLCNFLQSKNTFFFNDKKFFTNIKHIYTHDTDKNANFIDPLFHTLQHNITNNRYYSHYQKHVVTDFIYKQNFENLFMIPKIQKIVLNITTKNIVNEKKHIIPLLACLQIITGHKAKYTIAHKSIATFKIRKNIVIGCKVDLRNIQMYNFLEKLITIILPKARSFNGINVTCLSVQKSLSIGLPEILSFPELENYFEFFSSLKGIDITVVTNIKKNNIFINQSIKHNHKTLFFSAFQFPVKK